MITEGQTEKQGTNTPTPRRDSPEGGPLKQQDHNSQAGFCDPPIPAVLTLSQTIYQSFTALMYFQQYGPWYFVRIFLKQVPLHPPRLRNTARRRVKGWIIVKSGNISHFLFRTMQLFPNALLIHFLPENYGADEFLLAMLIGNKQTLFPPASFQ